jgi:hypothetical protein
MGFQSFASLDTTHRGSIDPVVAQVFHSVKLSHAQRLWGEAEAERHFVVC